MEAEQIDMTAPAAPAEKKVVSIADLLRGRYPAKTHVLLFEVRDAAGFGASRSCDALAISTWPSRGLDLIGFEFKESRADWLREYREPEKAELFQAMCDRWYLVVGQGDGKIVQMDELPASWGLLVRKGNRLVCEKEAPKNPAPEPLDRTFLAAILKNCRDTSAAPGKAEFDKGYSAGKAAQAEHFKDSAKHVKERHEALQRAVYEFEKASGVTIQTWDGQRVGEAVKLVLEGGHRRLGQNVESMLVNARGVVSSLEKLKECTQLSERASPSEGPRGA